MATVITDNKHYKNIAEKIRERTGQNSKYRSDALADGVEEVYQQGIIDGKNSVPEIDLPGLTNPADAADIRLNREAIAEDGSVLRGTMPEHSGENVELKMYQDPFLIEEGFHEERMVSVAFEPLITAKAKKDEAVLLAAKDNKFIGFVEIEPATDIYDAGFEIGRSEGFAQGAHLNQMEFWHFFQDGGKRTNYSYAFYMSGWNDNNFYPQYNIVPANANIQSMFAYSGITNLKQRLIDCGVSLDTSGCTQLYMFAQSSTITHFPELGGTKVTNCNNAFQNCRNLMSIDKLNISTTAACSFSSAFLNTIELVEIRFNSGIKPTGLNLGAASKLSKESLENLISSIAKDHSTTITLSATAINSAYPDRSVWTAFLNANKPANVTITEA